ncbi:putative ABC transport system substrate-binding protein [Bradyrhizobium japonicum]
MKRREFIFLVLGTAISCPVMAMAQQSKTVRVGMLNPSFAVQPPLDAFRKQLGDLGYIEGKNLIIDYRTAEGHFERLPQLVKELVALRPDVLVAIATPAIAAAQRATSTIPIVMSPSTDPIGSGFIKSFAHPGGNITGVANMYGDVMGKSVETLHELLPAAKTVAVLMSLNTTHPTQYELARAALQSFGKSVFPVVAPTPDDLPDAFHKMTDAHCDALFVLADPFRPTIASLAASSRIPAVYQYREFVDAGGLASYGANNVGMFKMAARYVDRILKGASPSETPVEQPTKFELIVNLKTAKALGLTVPPSILARADEVIE